MTDLDYLLDRAWPEPDPGLLTPETEPDAIAAAQRTDVSAAVKACGRDPAAIAVAVDLPAWTVWRRLKELGIVPATARPVGVSDKYARDLRRQKVTAVRKRVQAFLSRHGPASVRAIALKLNLTYGIVKNAMFCRHEFRVAGRARENGASRESRLWAVAEKEAVAS